MALSAPIAIAISFVTLLVSSSAASPPSYRTATYTKASFVPPATPTQASPLRSVQSIAGWPSAVNHPSRAQYRSATLFAKKKKGGGGGTAAPSKKGKIQVLLLETVPNLGQAGDVVLVSSAIFQNQLKRGNKARLVSAEEIQKMEEEREAHEQELAEMAAKTKSLLEEAMLENLGGENVCDDDGDDICGVALTMRRKAGPEGNLFGGVNPKMVMDALKEKYPGGSWDGRQVKLAEVKDADGKDVKKKDIKHTGEYTMKVALGKDVEATFILSILAE